jgi:hypothetical protein
MTNQEAAKSLSGQGPANFLIRDYH